MLAPSLLLLLFLTTSLAFSIDEDRCEDCVGRGCGYCAVFTRDCDYCEAKDVLEQCVCNELNFENGTEYNQENGLSFKTNDVLSCSKSGRMMDVILAVLVPLCCCFGIFGCWYCFSSDPSNLTRGAMMDVDVQSAETMRKVKAALQERDNTERTTQLGTHEP